MSSPLHEAVLPQRALEAPPRHPFAYRGDGTSLFALVLKNMLLTLVTAGIYLPWAKTERRKYVLQHTEIAGHRLRYHGTGKELFMGYLKVVGAYVLFFGVPLLIGKLAGKTAQGITQFALVLVLIPLVPYAIWGSRRYLLSRTSWRGIHFRLEGSAKPYAKVFLLGYLLTIVTLGLYGPIWLNRMHRLLTEGSALGTQRFQYYGEDKEAFRLGIKGFLLSLVTLGIYGFWYQAALARFQIENTRFGGAYGQFEVTGGDLLRLTLLQVFGMTFSLGLAFPWIVTYSLRFVLERTRFVGPIDFAHVYQAESSGNAAADGLADALDVGLAI